MGYRISKYEVDELGRNAEVFPGFAFKSDQFTDDPTDIALVKGENVQQGFVDWGASKYWSATDADSYKKFELRTGDVVLAMDRPWVTAGLKWAYIKKHDPKALLVQRVSRLRAKSGLDQTYLRCLISSRYFSDCIQPIVTGVNVPHISGKQIGGFEVPLPAQPIQEKIAAIISAYDEMIENNKQRIALLEKLAEEIYREWFVRLRFPNRKTVKLVNRPLRSFIFQYVGGDWGEDVQSPRFGNPVYVIRGTDFESVQQGDISSVPLRFIKDSGLRNRKLKAGDLIVENSVNHASRTAGKSMLVTQHVLDLFEGDVICASFCKLIRPKDTKHSKFLALNFRLLFDQGLFDYFQNIATNGIANLQAERLMDRHLIPFHDAINLSIFESLDTSLLASTQAKLKETRDKLLPRLISGKLAVENLDIQFPPGMAEELNSEHTEIAHA
jgi:type I restriction enzyme S subunit